MTNGLWLHPEFAANLTLVAAAALGLTVGMLPALFYSLGVFMPVSGFGIRGFFRGFA